MSTGNSTETIQDHTSALKLWRAVINQSVIDSASQKGADRAGVIRWIASDDFDIVCGLAGLNEHTIKRILVSILHEHPARAQYLCKKFIKQIEEL